MNDNEILIAGIKTVDVVSADPLGADGACRVLPCMNDRTDVTAIVSTLTEILPTQETLNSFSAAACAAAMRDVGIFLGSLKRHNVEPCEAVPGLERILIELGQRTGMPPRNTVHHYGVWNPMGERERKHTSGPHESILIDSVRVSMPALTSAVRALDSLFDEYPGTEYFTASLACVTAYARTLLECIDCVRRDLPAELFARSLRPYFSEVVIGGQPYLGPTAAHLPVYLLDHILWNCDGSADRYSAYQTSAASYSTPEAYTIFDRWHAQESLAARICAALESERDSGRGAQVHATAAQFCDLLRVIVTCRGRHLTQARRAYDEEVRLFAHGAGGETVEFLKMITDMTREASAQVAGRKV